MNANVRITDVAPRDGLQNEAGIISTADKAELVRLLCLAGVDEVEVSSFVSPKWVPQLADSAEVFARTVTFEPENVVFSPLVPNETGMQAALATNQAARDAAAAAGRPNATSFNLIDKITVFTAASESFSKKNTN